MSVRHAPNSGQVRSNSGQIWPALVELCHKPVEGGPHSIEAGASCPTLDECCPVEVGPHLPRFRPTIGLGPSSAQLGPTSARCRLMLESIPSNSSKRRLGIGQHWLDFHRTLADFGEILRDLDQMWDHYSARPRHMHWRCRAPASPGGAPRRRTPLAPGPAVLHHVLDALRPVDAFPRSLRGAARAPPARGLSESQRWPTSEWPLLVLKRGQWHPSQHRRPDTARWPPTPNSFRAVFRWGPCPVRSQHGARQIRGYSLTVSFFELICCRNSCSCLFAFMPARNAGLV